jgi:hypothetical protein
MPKTIQQLWNRAKEGDRWQMIALAESKCEFQIMTHQLNIKRNKYKCESSATKTKPRESSSITFRVIYIHIYVHKYGHGRRIRI